MKSLMTPQDFERFNAAAKMIEADADQAYRTCRKKYGPDAAGMLLVAFLRRAYGSMESWPPSDEVVDKVRARLEEVGILEI